MSANVGCGTVDGLILPRLLPQHADHVPQLLQRLVGRQPQQLGALPHLVGRQVTRNLERPGVQRDQGDAVGEHVVHLPRDARSLGEACTFGVEQLIGLRSLGTVPQGGDELTPGTDEHAPCNRCGGKGCCRQEHRPGVGPSRARSNTPLRME